ncbi:IclR family transcriptional regulator [Sediminispirochaeta smaragdinae]|uniref:Transcriptional regulator, IclR family n=1 Tax=Sediminispirochaeta smaragdinae (strain DSM 11293 / JCM 15392 / SEBR 4228) TaxID=573413 RepID=E1RBH6_SEDSS|nr:IclR family transcriptional regulator [Sediminispirochaeta smaragdinae]ADK79706.1 transcriptional regulator, IclR family [Sediminispirochaeta smaragdinae DSM 11293]
MADHGVIHTVVTASEILEYIAEKGGAQPAEIAKDLGLARANVHRHIATLYNLGFVEKRSDGRCVLTFRLFELGNTVPHTRNLIDPARPAMLRLSQDTGQTVNHGILHEASVLFIDKVDANAYLMLERPIGTCQPLYCTSLGKVLLAFQPEAERERLISSLDLIRHTEHTITDRDRLREALNLIREEGFGCDFQEMTNELNCVAAPVFGSEGKIVSAISISAPVDHFDRAAIEAVVTSLTAIADEVSRHMTR